MPRISASILRSEMTDIVEKPRSNPDGPYSAKGAHPKIICFFASVASFDTGMPICTFKLISHFSKVRDYSVFALFPAEGEFVERVRRENVTVGVIPFFRLRSVAHVADFFRFCVGWATTGIRIARFVRKNRISLVHFSDFIDLPFYPFAKLGGAKAVAHIRSCVDKPTQRIALRFTSAFFCDSVVFISQAARRFAKFPKRRANIVLDAGPDYTIFDPSREYPLPHPAFGKGRVCIATIAKFHKVKGHDHFVRMAAEVNRAMPGRVQFVIVGHRENGHEYFFDQVMALSHDLGLDDCLTVLDQMRHEEIPGVLAHSHIFAHLPRYQEGLGAVVLEAMAMGLPIVAFESGGVGECFRDGTDGFLVPHHDHSAAAQKIILLAQDTEMRERMGSSGKTGVREAFSIAGHAAAIDAIYRGLI